MERAFNVHEGLKREDDVLPERLITDLITEAIIRGPSQGHKVDDLEAMKDEFYRFCGWDLQTGVPLVERLEALDIGWVTEWISDYPGHFGNQKGKEV